MSSTRPPPPIPAVRTELTTSPRSDAYPAPAALDGTAGGAAIATFIKFHPFMAFFCWVAHIQHLGQLSPEAEVRQLRADHTKLYWICLWLDMIILAVAVVGVLILAGAVAFKAVWPILPANTTNPAQ